MNYHSRAKRFAASLPKDRALAILREIDEAERMLWTERVRGPKASMIIHQIMMERAHVGSGMTSQGRSSQESRGNHRHLRSFVASQTSLPRQWAHGQQRTGEAVSFVKHTSRTSVQATVAPWEPMFVPWWFVIAVMFAA